VIAPSPGIIEPRLSVRRKRPVSPRRRAVRRAVPALPAGRPPQRIGYDNKPRREIKPAKSGQIGQNTAADPLNPAGKRALGSRNASEEASMRYFAMRAITIAAVLAAGLALPNLAAGQTGRGGTGGAPVGHRQPATKDATKDPATPRVTMTKEDRALDRALKGICRGC
jgi:hypothetical protein